MRTVDPVEAVERYRQALMILENTAGPKHSRVAEIGERFAVGLARLAHNNPVAAIAAGAQGRSVDLTG